ncbi:class I SAM-dependent methyltransferase [Desulforamulus ferrireducens]|uniref:Methyltransferase type 11 n=1 Tax=Desulforamulus ferrireducens TaxID=1833852 RepID=A0A1S6IU63_9FIRM|nr:class I SAM-dependent methyltransferase [Desulforamulus ferrireducens]AQS58303.1 methyltransferase type 11 [Desulforamulus ferrireducens]
MPHVFDAKKLAKLDDPRRKEQIPVDKILELLGVKTGEFILDFGCGIGFLALPTAKVVGDTGFVYGVDIQEAMLVEALNRSKQEKLFNIAWVLTHPDKITLPTASIDCVMMGMVAHEVPDLKGMLAECGRVLKPGGRIGIVEWNQTFTAMGPPLDHRLKPEVLQDALSQLNFSEIVIHDISQGAYLVVGRKA